MARSPFTLAAAVTAALPGAEVTGTRPLTAGGDGRFDSAVVTLADGRELAIRVATTDDSARDLAAESLALRALTAGAREILPFRAPEYLGETRMDGHPALVTALLPGFQIDAADMPGGRGAAWSAGRAIAALHALPASVVRSAGLSERDENEVRVEIGKLIDRAADSGRVPTALSSRWRRAVDDESLWRFEPVVALGGLQSDALLYEDDDEQGPQVVGVIDWHGLSVGDPAVDLAWLSAAPDAADDVHSAYAEGAARGVDDGLQVRARLHAELEFARWLVHGVEQRRDDIIDDAAALLSSLADSVHDDLRIPQKDVVDDLPEVPEVAVPAGVSTAMETDAYRPEDLWPETDGDSDAEEAGDGSDEEDVDAPAPRPAVAQRGAADDEMSWVPRAARSAHAMTDSHRAPSAAGEHADLTEDLSVAASDAETQDFSDATRAAGLRDEISAASPPSSPESPEHDADRAPRFGPAQSIFDAETDAALESESGHGAETDLETAEEAQRAARAALQRWTRSSSE